MRCIKVVVAAVVVIVLSGASNAQTEGPSRELKKLEAFVGEWTYKGEQTNPPVAGLPYGPAGKYFGTSATRYILNGAFLETKIEDNNPSGKTSIISVVGYDPKGKNYVVNQYVSDGSRSVATATLNGRTWTTNSIMTTAKGAQVPVKVVVRYSSDWSSYAAIAEVSPDDGKTWKFWFKDEATKVDKNDIATGTTREDFEEFCKLHEGRWVCDSTWAADWPGVGKKGDKVTVYRQWTVTEDGNALLGKFYGGKGTYTELLAYDAGAKRTKGMTVGSGGYVGNYTVYKRGDKWILKGTGSEADGTKAIDDIKLAVSDNGNTITATGSVKMGDKIIDIPADVWRRVSK